MGVCGCVCGVCVGGCYLRSHGGDFQAKVH